MKFSRVNDEQIKQANEATEIIIKLRKVLAKQRLLNRAFGQYILSPKRFANHNFYNNSVDVILP